MYIYIPVYINTSDLFIVAICIYIYMDMCTSIYREYTRNMQFVVSFILFDMCTCMYTGA